MLDGCGMPRLDSRNPFDWLILNALAYTHKAKTDEDEYFGNDDCVNSYNCGDCGKCDINKHALNVDMMKRINAVVGLLFEEMGNEDAI